MNKFFVFVLIISFSIKKVKSEGERLLVAGDVINLGAQKLNRDVDSIGIDKTGLGTSSDNTGLGISERDKIGLNQISGPEDVRSGKMSSRIFGRIRNEHQHPFKDASRDHTRTHRSNTRAHGGNTRAHGGNTRAHGGNTRAHEGRTRAHEGRTRAHEGRTRAHEGRTRAHEGRTRTYGGRTRAHEDSKNDRKSSIGKRSNRRSEGKKWEKIDVSQNRADQRHPKSGMNELRILY